MKRRVFRSSVVFCSVMAPLLFSAGAEAGNWSSQAIGTSPPLWYEYRASVNDAGVIAASTLSGALTQPVLSASGASITSLPTPPLSGLGGSAPAVVQGAAMEISSDGRVVGFRAAANAPQRQASYWHWSGSAATHHDLHASTAEGYGVSAAYGISGDGLYIAGYIREKISPDTLSLPGVWNVSGTAASPSFTWTSLALPGGADYGIAYGVSDRSDSGGKRFACGGTGSSGGSVGTPGFLSATCWDLTTPGAPSVVAISETRAGTESGIATSTVNRVRTVNVGSSSTPVWQTFAVGYFVGTNGAVVGFVKNLTTGAFDVNSALDTSYDSILSDVTRQSFSQNAARANTPSTLYHGPLLVGTGATSAARVDETSGIVTTPALAVRGIYQTRIARDSSAPSLSAQERADTAQTCNLETELAPTLPGPLEIVSGVSRNALHMVGATGGQLVRLSNSFSEDELRVYARNAVVRAGVNGAQPRLVQYYWAEVANARDDADYRILFSDRAGCAAWGTNGALCTSSLAQGVESAPGLHAQRTRFNNAMAPPAEVYLQAVKTTGGACVISPVYALVDVGVTYNPEDPSAAPGQPGLNSHVPSGEEQELWAACGVSAPAPLGEGYNTDLRSDFDHCGVCSRSADDGFICTDNSCAQGVRQASASGQGCWIDGAATWGQGYCVADGDRRDSANPCRVCDEVQDPSGWSAASVPATPRMRCNAHGEWHWTYSDGNLRLDAYTTAHLCTTTPTGSNDNANWVPFSVPVPTGAMSTLLRTFTRSDGDATAYFNMRETRTWLNDNGVAYLGQFNPGEANGVAGGLPANAVNFNIPVSAEDRWYAVYYNDRYENNPRDLLGVELHYDTATMGLGVDLYYVCGYSALSQGFPRLNGITRCGPRNGWMSSNVSCEEGGNAWTNESQAYTFCRSTGEHTHGTQVEALVNGCPGRGSTWDLGRKSSGWMIFRVYRTDQAQPEAAQECRNVEVRVTKWNDEAPHVNSPAKCCGGAQSDTHTHYTKGDWESYQFVSDHANQGPTNRNNLGSFMDWVDYPNTSTGDVRSRLFNLGIITVDGGDRRPSNGSWHTYARPFQIPVPSNATPGQFVDQEEWFTFRYHDDHTGTSNQNGRDKVEFMLSWDAAQDMDIQADLFFRCDVGNGSDNWQRWNQCEGASAGVGNSGYGGVLRQTGSYKHCESQAPATVDGQRRVRVRAQISACQSSNPSFGSANRSGWAVLRVRRKARASDLTNPVCAPITLSYNPEREPYNNTSNWDQWRRPLPGHLPDPY